MIEVRPLTGTSWDELAAAFGEAFGDYAVPMAMSADALAAMQRRRGYAPEVSFGAFEGGRLIGFVLTCLDGDRAYNSGTGVVPARRRHGVARRLVEAVIGRASEPWVALGDREAAAVVFPGSADLPLLAVAHDARRRGHGARLLAAAASRCARPLRILNVDARAEGIAAFLAAVGAEPLVEQLEMAR